MAERRKATRKAQAKAKARPQNRPSAKRSRAILGVLRREPKTTVSREALSRQAKKSAAQRGPKDRSQAAVRAVRTKGPVILRTAARKAARSRRKRAAS